MMRVLIDYWFWIKSFHLVSVIAWMAGLFYLPRLFVYHSKTTAGTEMHVTFLQMEDKLYRFIMQPAMIFSLTSGSILATIGDTWQMPWLRAKLLSITFLLVFHFLLRSWYYDFKQGNFCRSERFYRVVNEVPTILLVIIVICVVIKPF
jgi:putative membrane protein